MKKLTVHKSSFGKFAPIGANVNGYIEYHDSPRYSRATNAQLEEWASDARMQIVRNAARIELANRKIRSWNEKSEYPQ